ncbi:MAG: sugar ABC transporter ATP-binding protein [Christensenella sp.]|uniref:sugar ABC transporter ATP-binding protein n=1 Tax=Christensenella sp. TaxID=1935934 RepID=UPI002B1EEC91|nr:sugar ABC transporter ATP-binding protein [Christensenella sp.]MEA5002371.1 sugar ABC transporter ATP-binding protein [Christensenella sp.]
MEPVIVFKGIKKYFPGTKALDWNEQDEMKVMPGQIHGLVGENGAGKSTLFQILMGIYTRTEGTILFDGKPFTAKDALDAEEAGISIIMQQPNFVYNLSVAENIFLGMDKQFKNKVGLIDWKRQNDAARKVLSKVGYDHIDPTAIMSQLGFEERKQVEIARALSSDPKVLLVDETSAAISKESVENLYTLLRKQRDKGMAIIYISHFIDEVYELCDRVTIMRDGKYITDMQVKETTPDMIISKMVGRDVSMESYRSDDNSSRAGEMLRVDKLSKEGAFEDISLNVHAGEIVGIAGIGGCGSDDFGKALFGYEKVSGGSITYKGKKVVIKSPSEALRQKIGYIPKDRDREGLVLKYNVTMNISAANLPNVTKKGMIDQKGERRSAQEFVHKFKVKTPSIDTNVQDLSGGNRQKVAIAKWIANDSDLLIVNSPTRGVDIGAKYEIYHILEELKNKGKAILLISDELPELLGMSDRIYCFKKGSVSAEFDRGIDFTEETVISAMV